MAGTKIIVARTILLVAAGAAAIAVIARPVPTAPAKPVVTAPIPPAQRLPARGPTSKAIATSAAMPAPAPSPAPLVVRRVLASGGPIAFGDYLWDETGAPAGPIVITVDVAAQTLSVFRDGYEIGATAILYGADEKPTPLGTFPITQKDAQHFSRTYGGAPMPYSLRLTGDGVFIHGSKVEWGYATHGCIGVPVAFAKKLFAVASVGDRVIVTKGKIIGMGQPIAS